ncbi:MAG: hypothetical protein ACTSQF_00290 [Candidatus Heimdallarchaeaceae archaeon]
MSRITTGTCPNCGQSCQESTDGTVDCLECGFYSTMIIISNYRTLEELNEERFSIGCHVLSELPEQNFYI